MAKKWLIAAAASVVVTAWVVAGCRPPHPTASPPPGGLLSVAATPFALAEMAHRVGLTRVSVSDHGDLALDAGRTDPWLDPVAMQSVAQHVADAFSGHDPAGRRAYQAAARAVQAQLGALDIDYRSSLADCGRHDIVTADGAFAPLAARYHFAAHRADDPGVAAVITAKGIPVLFTETGVPADAVAALAGATATAVMELDTMTVRTPVEAARGATYFALMTDNLAKLRKALACTSG